MRYNPESFWETAHHEVDEQEAGLGEGIRHVGGGGGILEARYLYALRGFALQRVCDRISLQTSSADSVPLEVFEFGCGSGYWISRLTRLLEPLQIHYSGVDISPTAIVRLQNRHPECFFTCMENPGAGWTKLFERKPFDISLAIDVLYHITDDDAWTTTLRNIAKITKPGGYFIFSDLGYSQPRSNPSKSHVKHRSLQAYLDELESGGFEIIHIEPMFFFFNRIKYGPFRDHSKLVAAMWRMADHFPFLMRGIYWIDRGVTKFLRPLDPRCKKRLFLCKKL